VCTNPALFRSLLRLRKKPSSLQWRHAANTFQKDIPNSGINFKDTYRTSSTHTCIDVYYDWFCYSTGKFLTIYVAK